MTVILSGALSLATLTVGESSPFRGIARRVFVGDLSVEESRSMIRDFLQEYGVRYTTFAQERLLEASSGDTFLIRKLSQQCAELLQDKSITQLGATNARQVIKHFLEEDVYQYAPLLEAVRLIEELGLRTQRIEPMINTLEDFSRRVDELKTRIDEHKRNHGSSKEREPWLMEFRNILRAVQETPTSLRNRVRSLKQVYAEYQEARHQGLALLPQSIRPSCGRPRRRQRFQRR